MSEIDKIIKAILILNSNAKFYVKMNIENTLDTAEIEWLENTTPISKADILVKQTELQTVYDNSEYQRKRKAEYPSIEELVVALYDTEDKLAIENKRAEIKAKYPKENS